MLARAWEPPEAAQKSFLLQVSSSHLHVSFYITFDEVLDRETGTSFWVLALPCALLSGCNIFSFLQPFLPQTTGS